MAFTLTLKPEIEQRLRELAEAEHRSMHKTVEVAIQAYLDRHDRDEWTRQAARRVYERNAEFYEMLPSHSLSEALEFALNSSRAPMRLYAKQTKSVDVRLALPGDSDRTERPETQGV